MAEPIARLIGDNAHDSDRLDQDLADTGVEMIAPQRSNRKNRTQASASARLFASRNSWQRKTHLRKIGFHEQLSQRSLYIWRAQRAASEFPVSVISSYR